MSWANAYVGKPWRAHGRGPDAFDCWGLVADVLARQFNVTVPSYVDAYGSPYSNGGASVPEWAAVATLILHERHAWADVQVGTEIPGDVVLLRVRGHPIHVGVVVSSGDMLHCLEPVGVCLENYRTGLRWRERVVGIFRAPECASV